MANPPLGYRFGPRCPVEMKVDSSSADIEVGDLLAVGTAGYVQQAAAGNMPVGWAMQARAAGTADGDVSILVDVSELAVYELAPDAGSVTQALANTQKDVGGAQSVDIDANTDKSLVIRYVDVDANTILVSLAPASIRLS